MDAIDFFLLRYREMHGRMAEELLARLPEAEVRGRPVPGVNTIAWLLWHTARIEDVGVNRFVIDGAQVLDGGWLRRLGVPRRDVGTGMTGAEVDELSGRIDLGALGSYWEAVGDRTLAVVDTLRGSDLEVNVPAERVERVSSAEGAVAREAAWLAEFWAAGRSRAWFLEQTPLLHVYGHWFEARVTAGLWGHPSL